MCALHRGEIQRSREDSALENLLDDDLTRTIVYKNGSEEISHFAILRRTGTRSRRENSVVDVKEPIRAFILEYAADRGVTEVKDDDSLLTTNIIDSLGSFRLIAFLEETFPLTVEDTDMVPENFHTLNAIESFVAGKLGKADGEAGH
jgi:acyl carrier protein